MNTFLHEVYEWIYSIIIALAIAMVIHIFFFQPTRVSGESMMPTLHNGEYLIVSKWNHVLGEVRTMEILSSSTAASSIRARGKMTSQNR